MLHIGTSESWDNVQDPERKHEEPQQEILRTAVGWNREDVKVFNSVDVASDLV